MQNIEGKLFAFSYGVSECPAHLVFAGDQSGKTVTMPWSYFLLRTSGENILIDCGFSDPEHAAQFGIRLVPDPVGMIAAAGIAPKDVDTIIVTHHHFDHTGNLPHFPQARIIIQQDDYEPYRKECPDHPEISPERLTKFDREFSYAGLRLKHVGGHTPGSIEITFRHDGKTFVITGDECYMRRNFEQRCPIGYAQFPEVNRAYIKQMPDDIVLLPFHDPAIFNLYPKVADNVVGIF